MARFGLDYTGNLSAAQHKAVGSSFACRYLSNGNSKDLDPGEAAALLKGGVDVVVVWETVGSRALQGHAAGEADARAAEAEAQRLGLPAHRPIYFAVDFDEAPSQAGAVAAYFQGVRTVLPKSAVGVYGGYWVVKRLHEAGLVGYIWQTYAWSGGQLHPAANIYQYSNGHVVAGVGVDYNRALTADFGQWGFAPKLKDPAGIWRFSGEVDTHDGSWKIQPEPGVNVVMGEHPRRWVAEISVSEQHGDWQIHSRPGQEVK